MVDGTKTRMVGRADPELHCPANTLRQGAGVSGAFDAKQLFRGRPAPLALPAFPLAEL